MITTNLDFLILSCKMEFNRPCAICQVLETAHNVGRMSVCTAHDASYKETANHCETLLMGKQQKMSNLINAHHKHGNLLAITAQGFGEENKQTAALYDGHQHKVLLFILDNLAEAYFIYTARYSGLVGLPYV